MSKLSTISQAAALLDYDGRTVAAVLAALEYGDGLVIDSFAVSPSQIEAGASVELAISGTITGTASAFSVVDSVSGAVALTGEADAFTGTVTQAESARTLTLTATNANAPSGVDTKTGTASVVVLNRLFWGVSASAVLTSGEVIALAGSALGAQRALSLTLEPAGQYLWFAYPAAFGDPERFTLLGLNEEPVLTTVSVTTAAGATLDYRLVRSPNPLTGSVPVEVS